MAKGEQLWEHGIQAADFLSSQGAVGLKAEETALLIEVLSAAQSMDGGRGQQAARKPVLESAPLSLEVSSPLGKGSMLAGVEMSTCHN